MESWWLVHHRASKWVLLTKKSNDEEDCSHGCGGPLYTFLQVSLCTILCTPVLGPLLFIVFVVHLQLTGDVLYSLTSIPTTHLVDKGFGDKSCSQASHSPRLSCCSGSQAEGEQEAYHTEHGTHCNKTSTNEHSQPWSSPPPSPANFCACIWKSNPMLKSPL